MEQKIDKEFEELVERIKGDENILAFWLDGSRGKGMITENSDYDCKMIVIDSVLLEYKEKYNNKEKSVIEISVMTLDELKNYAKLGSDTAWDRYNFAHLKVVFDRTAQIQKIIDNKVVLSKEEQSTIIKNSLGIFINQLYRLEKNKRDGNITAARLDAIEAVPAFIEAIFALEGKVRPYNKYLGWELENYPLEKFPWERGELVEKLILATEENNLHILYGLFLIIRPIFKSEGYSQEFDGWKGNYKVGE